MCRLIGIVASELTEFGLVLTGAPRCLATLSREHPDGWGLAFHDAAAAPGTAPWLVHKGVERAGDDHRFLDLATRARGHVLVAHIRQKTVGPTRLENSHPFVRDGWVFAHNGTVQAIDALRDGTSDQRRDEVVGETDSERLFAYLLTQLDVHGLTSLRDAAAREAATTLLEEITARLRESRIGAFNFLLSDGETTFAHRCGRSLYVLERGPENPPRESRELAPGAQILTRWTPRRQAVFIASERITDEPWIEIADGTLVRVDRSPMPGVTPSIVPASRATG